MATGAKSDFNQFKLNEISRPHQLEKNPFQIKGLSSLIFFFFSILIDHSVNKQ